MLLCGPFLSVLSLLSGEGNEWNEEKRGGCHFTFFVPLYEHSRESFLVYAKIYVLVVDPS